MTNKLKQALIGSNDDLDGYLEVTSTEQIKSDIQQLVQLPEQPTLRDYFAARAMQSYVLSMGTNPNAAGFFGNQSDPMKTLAGFSFKMAEAMLRQRNEHTK